MDMTATRGAVVWIVMMLGAFTMWTALPAHAQDSHVKGTMIMPLIEELAVTGGEAVVMAPGAAEDTLKTCIARIPKLASVGQYMLAEQSCVGEEKTRKAMRSAPKF